MIKALLKIPTKTLNENSQKSKYDEYENKNLFGAKWYHYFMLKCNSKIDFNACRIERFFLADVKKKLSFQGLMSRCFTKGLETLH